MTFRVILQPDAEADIFSDFNYIHDRAPASAALWLRGLHAAVDSLEVFPRRCGLAREDGELAEEIRQLLYGRGRHRRRILSTIRGDEVHVLHVRHAARRR